MAIATIAYAALGLVIIYFLAAVLVSHGVEVVSAYAEKRGSLLKDGIKKLINVSTDQSGIAPSAANQKNDEINVGILADAVYNHGLIGGMLPGDKKPAYVTAPNFAMAFLHRLGDSAATVNKALNGADAPPLTTISGQIALLPDDCALKSTLQALDKEAQGKIDVFSNLLEVHYNNVMDRITGQYKKWSRQISIIIAIAVVAALNLDTIAIFRAIDADVRLQNAVQQGSALLRSGNVCAKATDTTAAGSATATTCKTDDTPTPQQFAAIALQLAQPLLDARLPVGWTAPDAKDKCAVSLTPFSYAATRPGPDNTKIVEYKADCPGDTSFKDWIFKLAGWLFTAFAASLGAPFWFRLFEQIVRQTGIKPPNLTTADRDAEQA